MMDGLIVLTPTVADTGSLTAVLRLSLIESIVSTQFGDSEEHAPRAIVTMRSGAEHIVDEPVSAILGLIQSLNVVEIAPQEVQP